MKTLFLALAVASVAALAAGCRKVPKYDDQKQSQAAPNAPAPAPAGVFGRT